MIRIEAPDFDLSATLDSGQTFCWEIQPDGAWQGWIHDLPCRLVQKGTVLEIEGDAPETAVRNYFQLDETWESIVARLPDDPVARAAAESCRGLRCIQDGWWECTANFICSSLKQIPQIRRINRALRASFSPGKPVWPEASFPSPAQIAAEPETLLRAAGLGFRARHLHRAALQLAAGGFDYPGLLPLPIAGAADRLCEIPGVGNKVAHCILLYAGRRYEAFPLDVWMIRLLRQHYRRPGRSLATLSQMHRFAEKHLGEHRGLAQIYLFHHGRQQPKKPPLSRAKHRSRKRMRS